MDGNGSPPVFTNDRYTSAEFLQREKEQVFRTTWLVAARESMLPHPGDCLAVDELDESLVLVRGTDQVVRAFRNACRHRGTRLVSRRCSAPHIRCPYHGWTYDLDGRLSSVPKASGFADLDTDALGLSAVRTECWGGFVWITFSSEAPPLRQYLGALADELEPYHLAEMRPLLTRTWTLPCNWKAVLDQATESYHLRAVHPRLRQVVAGALSFRDLDPHYLQTIPVPDYPLRRWLDHRTTPSDLPFTARHRDLFHKLLVFPNTLLNVMPYHLTVFRVFPITPDSCRFHYEFHIRRRAGLVGRLRGWMTLLGSLYLLREDFGLLEPFQSGVRAAAGRTIRFHEEEQALRYFHGVVDRYAQVDGPEAAPVRGVAAGPAVRPELSRR